MTNAELQIKIMRQLQNGPLSVDQLELGVISQNGAKKALGGLIDLGYVTTQKVGTKTFYHSPRKIHRPGVVKTKPIPRRKPTFTGGILPQVAAILNSNAREFTVREISEALGETRSKVRRAVKNLVSDEYAETRTHAINNGQTRESLWRRAGVDKTVQDIESDYPKNKVLEVIRCIESTVEDVAAAIGCSTMVAGRRLRVLKRSGLAFVVGHQGKKDVWSSRPLREHAAQRVAV
jgi:predicted transcriptional regulator